MIEKPLVSICCICYNQEQYIRQTLDGFVMQQTSFPFEVVISDDCSKDGTRKVIAEYKEKYPKLIRDISPEQNKGSFANFFYVQDCALGKYIALCEGDDYWTDPYKLQKQVDILEADETLIGCCTNRKIVDFKGNTVEEKRPFLIEGRSSCRVTMRDFFQYDPTYPTMSVVYRNTHSEEVQQKTNHMRNPYLGDWTLWIALHCFGDFYYLDEVTSAYRLNPTSVTHTQWVHQRVDKVKMEFDLQPRVADVLPEEYADIAAELRNTNWVHGALVRAYYKDKSYLKMVGQLFVVAVKFPQFYKDLARRVFNKIIRKVRR